MACRNNSPYCLPSEWLAATTCLTVYLLQVYDAALQNLLPTPTKSHYLFNLRDFGRVIMGFLMANTEAMTEGTAAVRLWVHEVYLSWLLLIMWYLWPYVLMSVFATEFKFKWYVSVYFWCMHVRNDNVVVAHTLSGKSVVSSTHTCTGRFTLQYTRIHKYMYTLKTRSCTCSTIAVSAVKHIERLVTSTESCHMW